MASHAENYSRRNRSIALDVLATIGASPDTAPELPRLGIILAHPDDESVGASVLLPRLRDACFLYTTDGAPRNGHDANAVGCRTREEYAAARSAERASALATAGISHSRVYELGLIDQEASLHLSEMALEIAAWLEAHSLDVVLTHPYEGGHPDHDATAFAVHAACRVLGQRRATPPAILEMASYHLGPCGLTAGQFLPEGTEPVTVLELSEAQQEFKRQLFACYRTQQQTLSWFPLRREAFRPALAYDFARPPHDGPLFYEHFAWGMTGERFRQLAGEALMRLGLARI